MHTPLVDGKTTVHITEGEKVMDCVLPSYQISRLVGFNQEEVRFLLEFCRTNAHLLIDFARKGGASNA